MLAANAGGLAHVVDSVVQKPTPILLLPVDGRVATALRGADESSAPAAARRGGSTRWSATTTPGGAENDASYRYRRQRNNEAARRSREKRRRQDGVIRRQLEALAAENRDLRCQLALCRRLLDDVAAATTACSRDGGGALQPGWSPPSSVVSDRSRHDDVDDESSVDDGRESAVRGGSGDVAAGARSERVALTRDDDVADWQRHQLMTPLNLCRRVTRS